MDFGLFIIEQADEVVVLLDGFERFHEDGLSAGTGSVDDALDAALLFDFDRNDEALAADGDELVLDGAAFGQFAEVAAERFLDLAFLFFDFAANAAEFGGSTIVEGAVGQDLVAEGAEESGEILKGGGEGGNGGPIGAHGGGRLTDDFAPLGSAVGNEDNVADLGGFEGGTGNAGFLDELVDFGQAHEFETSADAAILADFGGELLLVFDPRAIERRQEFRDAALAERGRGVAGEQVAQGLELEQARAGVGHGIGDERHAC